MTASPAELVLHLFDAVNRRDVDRVVEGMAPDVVVDFSRAISPYRGIYRGRVEVHSFLTAWLDSWESVSWEAQELEQIGTDRVVVANRVRGRGRMSGIEIEARGGHVWEISDGLVARMTLFQDRQAAAAAAAAAQQA